MFVATAFVTCNLLVKMQTSHPCMRFALRLVRKTEMRILLVGAAGETTISEVTSIGTA